MDFWIQDVVTTWTLESFAVTKQKVDHLWRTPVKHKHHCASLRNFTYSQYGLKTWKAEKGNHCMYGYEMQDREVTVVLGAMGVARVKSS